MQPRNEKVNKCRRYAQVMGRPLQRTRPEQGQHLASLRMAAGLSQAALAEVISEPQSTIAKWELSPRPPRSDAIAKLARALGVSVEELLNINAPARRRGPVGKAGLIFQQVASLPRRQQDQVLQMVSIFIEAQRANL